jgi:hypothetical protein
MLAALCGLETDAAERMIGECRDGGRARPTSRRVATTSPSAAGTRTSRSSTAAGAASLPKDSSPAIRDAGGNIRGDDAFLLWTKVRENGGAPEARSQEDWVREREAWMARHEGDGSQFAV